jgi:hypothetical protein
MQIWHFVGLLFYQSAQQPSELDDIRAITEPVGEMSNGLALPTWRGQSRLVRFMIRQARINIDRFKTAPNHSH